MKQFLLALFNTFSIFCFIIGGAVIYFSIGMFITTFQTPVSFEELLDGVEIKKGSYVEGNLVYALSPIASKSTYKENKTTGSRTKAKISENYYAIPVSEGNQIIVLNSSEFLIEKMDRLAEETQNYMLGGDAPVTEIYINGQVNNLDNKLLEYYHEYMQEYGYTEDEIDNMPGPFAIDTFSKSNIRIMPFAGSFIILLGIGAGYFIYRKNKKRELAAEAL